MLGRVSSRDPVVAMGKSSVVMPMPASVKRRPRTSMSVLLNSCAQTTTNVPSDRVAISGANCAPALAVLTTNSPPVRKFCPSYSWPTILAPT
jgi:hypothetical protein